jgi:hypothetical protein
MVQLGQCECGADVIRAVSEMLARNLLLDAEPATEGRLLTIVLVGNAGGPFVLAYLEPDPFEIWRHSEEDLFREHSCEGQLVPIDREAAQPPSGAPPAVPGSGT